MTLDQFSPGQSCVVVAVGGEGALRRRLLDMGITPRTGVTVRKVAPLGDPIEIYLRGYELTIRKEEAAKIEVCLPPEPCNGRCSECARRIKEEAS